VHKFKVIHVFVRTAAAGDILVPTHGNFSILRPPTVVVEQDIRLPALTNVSDLDVDGHARVYFHEGVVDDIVLPALSNISVLAGGSPLAAFVGIAEAPPDGFIRLPSLINSSILSGGSPSAALVSVDVAPADGYIRLPALINSSVVGGGSPSISPEVQVISSLGTDTDDNNDGFVAGGSVGGRVV
jgi:hypothetical protein